MKALLLTLFALFVTSEVAQAEERVMLESPALYNGTRSVPGEFLPMGWIGMCTATAVAVDAIFTAGHCISNGQTVRFKSRFDGKSYQARCTKHPRYRNSSAYNDWAFCKLLTEEFPKDMPLVTMVEETPAVGERLLLNGYGAPTVGTHHWGFAPMSSVRGQDLVVCNNVSLGGGDSGGSLLKASDDRSGKSGFEVVGVNSRRQVGGNCSYFNRLSDPEFKSWVRDYERSSGVQICGISKKCTGSTPPPPPPPPPANCWQTYEEFAFCIGTKSIPACLAKAAQLMECVK